MSILLDALKKSEQQRQLGQTPTLQTNLPDQDSDNGVFGHWIPLSLVGLSVIVMAWFGWQQLRAPAVLDNISEPVVAVQPEEAQAAPAERTDRARTMTESLEDRAGAGSAISDNDRSRLSRSVSQFKAEDNQPEPGPSENEAPLTAAAGTPSAEAPTRAAPDTSPKRPPASRRSALEPHVAEPISYWELPQGIRDNLPEIQISVLVYSERPADRFVLGNGQRLTEQDELQSGLVLDEIRRDGAVFLYRNYRFLVRN
ncbi:MAG: GspB domain-containing protein [Xanthomonadales bacterium]|nr:general secretion pathway protein GspB [Gammaproteobacteria bacterium]MBT8054988.1 general secretion pathway protein GspB [Gammaproteobacteria bacterium]NND56370.1 GspB domain-containing protein [Xanthomonadales bacterium]NNK50427.1 GspB domain-containing protein [Xanthomonadales bacterium]